MSVATVLKYNDDELDAAERASFEAHLETCACCSERVRKERLLKEALQKGGPAVTPPMNGIWTRIENQRDKVPKKTLNVNGLLRKAALPAAALLLIALVWFIPSLRHAVGTGLLSVLNKENRLSQNVTGSETLSFSSIKALSGQELVKDLNAKGMGVSMWEMPFASKERILLRNYASLLSFRNGELRKAAELDALGLHHIQGSIVTRLSVSPDGRYVVAGNWAGEPDVLVDTGIYLIQTDTGRHARLGTGDIDKLAHAWSLNGQWLAYADRKNVEKITLLNLDTLAVQVLSIPYSDVRKLYISNSGNVGYYDGAAVRLLKAQIGHPSYESIPEEPLYVDVESGIILYEAKGNVYEVMMGSDVIMLQMNQPLKEPSSVRLDGHFLAALLENGEIGIKDILSEGEIKIFTGLPPLIDYLPWFDLSPNGQKLLLDVDGVLYTLDEKSIRAMTSGLAYGNAMRWYDDDHLVYVEMLSDFDIQAGEFALYSLSLNGETDLVFRTTEESPSAADVVFNRAYLKPEALIYEGPDGNGALQEALMAKLADPEAIHEFNLYDQVVNGFVRVSYDDGIVGWVREQDIIYYDNYKTFSYEKNTLDLNGDGSPDSISVQLINGRDAFRLTVNSASIDGSGIDVTDQFRVVDINREDGYLEVVVEEFGPSSDPMSSFYYYDGSDLHFMGKVEGLCGNRDAVGGDGRVIASTRAHILQTWCYADYYGLDENRALKRIPQEIYYCGHYPDEAPLKILYPQVDFVEAPGSAAVSMTLHAGDPIYFMGSDDVAWCLFKTPDGREGWLEFSGFGQVKALGTNAMEVFAGLNNAD